MRLWYQNLWESEYKLGSEDFVNGYLARKQTHLVKLAMILAASKSDALEISMDDFVAAEAILLETEKGSAKVFSRIGRTEESLQVERFLTVIRDRKSIPYSQVFRLMAAYFPNGRECEDILSGIIKSGYATLVNDKGEACIVWNDNGVTITGS